MNGSILLQIAKDAIKSKFTGEFLNKDAYLSKNGELSQEGAAFVTLTENGKLRGCIGSLVAHRPLIDDIISNARSAAFSDPRFPPLNERELDNLSVEVSILTQPQKVFYHGTNDLRHIIRPGVDGVILVFGNQQATFLPQVWEDLPDFELFFSHLGMKAGIGNDPLSLHPDIYTYQVKKYQND